MATINTSLISSVFNDKRTFGRFYEIKLQGEIEKQITRMYPHVFPALQLQRNSQYSSCDYSQVHMNNECECLHHVNVELKTFRKGIFEDEYPTVNTITPSEREYFNEQLIQYKDQLYCFIVLYFHENNSMYIARITNINMLQYVPWKDRYAISKNVFRKVTLNTNYMLFLK